MSRSSSSNKVSLPDNKLTLPDSFGQSTVAKASGVIANCAFALSVFCIMFLIAFVSGSTFFSVGYGSAASEEVDIVVNIHDTIAITTDAVDDKLTIPIMPTHTGTLGKNELTVSVSTNNSTGYKLSMNSLTTNTSMVHESATGSPPAPNIPSTNHSYSTPGALGTDTWGWNLGSAASTNTFSMIPPSNASYTIRTTDTPSNTPSVNSDTLVTFGANVTSNTPAGAYINTIVFTATANPTPQTIRISSISPTTNWSGGDIYLTGTNFPTVTTGTTITVGGTACASYRLIDTNNAICVLPDKLTGGTYPVVMTSAALGQSNTNKTVTYDGVNKGNMQDFSSTTCSNMPMGLAQIWTDARNNAKYRIKKMLDNKCWMIDNLAYAGDPPKEDNTYGDVHTLTFTTACGTTNWNSSTVSTCADQTAWLPGNTTRPVTVNNFTGSNLNDRVGNAIQNTEANLYDGGVNIASCDNSLTGSGNMRSECLSYIYSWCAAIGLDSTTNPTCVEVREDSTITDSNGSTAGGTVNTGMAGTGIVGKPGGIGGESKGSASGIGNQAGVATSNGTICPAGWRLPVGRVGDADTNTSNLYNEWNILNESMYSLNLFTNTSSTTINGTTTGYFNNWYPAGSFSSVGSGYFDHNNGLGFQSARGIYWSSSLSTSANATDSPIYAGSVSPGTSQRLKRTGLAVRCVLN